MRLQSDSLLRNDAGQALTETAIGCCLFTMTFLLVTYTTFMSSNYIRTAMAARHAAWLKGNGGNPTPAMVDTNFFYQSGLSSVTQTTEESMGSALVGGDKKGYANDTEGPFRYEVSFGISGKEQATTFPFLLMKTRLPFMPETSLDHFLKVTSSCQWDEVSKTWDTLGSAMEGIYNTIKSEIFGG